MSAMIDIAGRVYVLPENVQLIAWKPLRTPHIEQGANVRYWACVIVETYHDAHFVPCSGPAEARALAESIRAKVDTCRTLRDLSRLAAKDRAVSDGDGAPVRLLAGEAA